MRLDDFSPDCFQIEHAGIAGEIFFDPGAAWDFDRFILFGVNKPIIEGSLAGWLKAVVALYTSGSWPFVDRRETGYSVVLFGAHGVPWRIDRARIAELRRTPGVSSIQITFEDEVPAEHHAMPPGGFRLAIVNAWDLDAGRAVRARLRELFSTSLREPRETAPRRGE